MIAIVVTIVGALLLLLATGVWVALAMFSTGIISLTVFRDLPLIKLLANSLWNATTTPELLALPLFVLMAEIIFRTRVSAMLFSGLAPWTGSLPGRLLHVNVLACTLFAATSGSSAATAAAVGRMTLSELFTRGYGRGLAIGSLGGAGTLGFLIPPSIILIIYGVLAEASIIKLFMAGLIPGLLLATSYMVYIGIRATISPELVPAKEAEFTWGDRLRGLVDIFPVLCLIVAIIGSMYSGVASPTEAAAIGVLGAFIISLLQRCLTWTNLQVAFLSAVRTSCMMGFLLAGGVFLSVTMGYLGLPRFIALQIGALELGPFQLILLLLLFYIVLGCFMDGMSTIVMTLPITLPLIELAEISKIWYGIFLVLCVEMAQITPPIGFNLFIIQGLTNEPISRTAWHVLPFFLITAAFTILMTVIPEVVLFLPRFLTGSV